MSCFVCLGASTEVVACCSRIVCLTCQKPRCALCGQTMAEVHQEQSYRAFGNLGITDGVLQHMSHASLGGLTSIPTRSNNSSSSRRGASAVNLSSSSTVPFDSLSPTTTSTTTTTTTTTTTESSPDATNSATGEVTVVGGRLPPFSAPSQEDNTSALQVPTVTEATDRSPAEPSSVLDTVLASTQLPPSSPASSSSSPPPPPSPPPSTTAARSSSTPSSSSALTTAMAGNSSVAVVVGGNHESGFTVKHFVALGDTLEGISLRYDVEMATIVMENKLLTSEVQERTFVLVPGVSHMPDYMEPTPEILEAIRRRQAARIFRRKTKATEQETKFYLDDNEWDVETALAAWQRDEAWVKAHPMPLSFGLPSSSSSSSSSSSYGLPPPPSVSSIPYFTSTWLGGKEADKKTSGWGVTTTTTTTAATTTPSPSPTTASDPGDGESGASPDTSRGAKWSTPLVRFGAACSNLVQPLLKQGLPLKHLPEAR